jgi:hypothetical protein
MFANILVPLDGSTLSEHALPMAQHLARSSETCICCRSSPCDWSWTLCAAAGASP